MIFPRYHQLQAVRQMVARPARKAPGHNYLIEHSAGSGKSNTIGWLAHRLASLHDEQDQRVFDSVIVVTDRLVLDQQLQDTIYQFEHRQGVVQKIDENSRQLAEALESGVPIIITTLQKFPFVSRQLLKLAEERGEQGSGMLPTRRCAVIIDEAHSSQCGEASTELKGVLGGEELFARKRKSMQRKKVLKTWHRFPQHGQTRTPSEPELLCFYRDTQSIRRWRYSVATVSHFIATPCGRRLKKASSWTF